MIHLKFQNFLQCKTKFFTNFCIRRAGLLMFFKKRKNKKEISAYRLIPSGFETAVLDKRIRQIHEIK